MNDYRNAGKWTNLPEAIGAILLVVSIISFFILGIAIGWLTALYVFASGLLTVLFFLSIGAIVKRQNEQLFILQHLHPELAHLIIAKPGKTAVDSRDPDADLWEGGDSPS